MGAGLAVLVAVLVLGLLARNAVVAGAAAILIALRLLHVDFALLWLGRYGLPIGYVFLVLAVLVPVALEQVSWRQFARDLFGWGGLTAVAVSAAGSWVALHGVRFMDAHPQVLVPLVVGTVVGTAILRGVPTGPLIAAGVTAIVLRLVR
ncbi:MAG: DUF441 family protein [Clostridia bacterium]|nr:DUF441 family protein [Clostridia bacterium]